MKNSSTCVSLAKCCFFALEDESSFKLHFSSIFKLKFNNLKYIYFQTVREGENKLFWTKKQIYNFFY